MNFAGMMQYDGLHCCLHLLPLHHLQSQEFLDKHIFILIYIIYLRLRGVLSFEKIGVNEHISVAYKTALVSMQFEHSARHYEGRKF